MKKNLYILLALAVALTTSCNKSENDNHLVQSFTIPGNYAYVLNTTDNTGTLVAKVGVGVELDITDRNADIVLTGLQLPNGEVGAMEFDDVPFTSSSDGWITIAAPQLKPDMLSNGIQPTISNLQMRYLDRRFDAQFDPAMTLRLIADDIYEVHIARTELLIGGKTTTNSVMGTFESQSTTFKYNLDVEKKTLDIKLNKAQFAEKMPAMDFELKDIPFTVNGTDVHFTADKLIPYIGNRPNDAFPILKLSGDINFNSGVSLSFECEPSTIKGVTFTVTSRCTYFDFPPEAE